MKGFSLEKLSQSLNSSVTRQAINKYEKGQMKPDSCVLNALANALEVKIDYFFRSFTVDVYQVEFRNKSRLTNKMAIAVKERVKEELERYLEIEQIVGSQGCFKLSRKEVRTAEDARKFANEIRQVLALGDYGISNVIEVLEDSGIKVIELSENESFDGLCGYANSSIPLIVVNGNVPAERKRFTALYELGNLLLDVPEDIPIKEVEQICNVFAREILLPVSVLKAKLGNSRHDISVSELTDIQRQVGISIDDIMIALRSCNVISYSLYSRYQTKKNDLPDFKELVEKSRIITERSGSFARMVYRALADESITFSKAAILLDTSIESVKSHFQLI